VWVVIVRKHVHFLEWQPFELELIFLRASTFTNCYELKGKAMLVSCVEARLPFTS